MLVQFCAFDRAYLERLRCGDIPTQRHFADYFGRLIRLKLANRMNSKSAIDDICQETFLRVWVALRKKGGIREPERFGAFVISVCNNVLREQRRKTLKEDQPDDHSSASLCDTRTGIVDVLVARELQRRVTRVLAELPANQRDLIRKVFLEECDKDDLCRGLRVTRNYLRVMLHRATRRFREGYVKELAAPARNRFPLWRGISPEDKTLSAGYGSRQDHTKGLAWAARDGEVKQRPIVSAKFDTINRHAAQLQPLSCGGSDRRLAPHIF